MNWLKKGPELKLSEIKVPDFLFDLYYDLKERRLLPLIALLLVAIVAVPILLSQAGSSESGEEVPAPASPEASISGTESDLVVAKATPGLRDYRRRLEHARSLDPFRQPQTSSGEGEGESGSSEVSSGGGEASAATGSSPTFEESSLPPIPSSETAPSVTFPEEGGGSSSGSGDAKYASNSIDVRIVSVPNSAGGDGKASVKPETEVRRGLPELTMLPSRETPAAVFMGTSADGKKALLLVSSDVASVFGDGQCVVGSETCQLLALEKGLPQTFVYGPQGRTYRIEILAIEKKLSDKPRRAALGSPKRGKDKGEAGTGPKPQPAPESPGGAG
jgi:hypothetical protein